MEYVERGDSSRLWGKSAFFICHCEISLWDFLRFASNFLSQISLWDCMLFAALVSYEFCFREVVLSLEGSVWNLSRFADTFLMRYPYEISCFLAVMRRLCEISCFCCTIFARGILMRLHAFLGRHELCVSDFMLFGVITCLDEISWFLAAEFSFWRCDVRAVKWWMLKDMREIECTQWCIARCVIFVVVVGGGRM